MRLKFLRISVFTLLLLTMVCTTAAQASSGGGEGGGNAQSPMQVIVQIAVTAIFLKGLNYFDLP